MVGFGGKGLESVGGEEYTLKGSGMGSRRGGGSWGGSGEEGRKRRRR